MTKVTICSRERIKGGLIEGRTANLLSAKILCMEKHIYFGN